MHTYEKLARLPADAYLNPDNFVDEVWDARSGRNAAQYSEGLSVGEDAEEITIAVNSVWGAKMLDGGVLTSYEGIGYHSCTAALLRGFLASPARVVVYRCTPNGVTRTVIKESSR